MSDEPKLRDRIRALTNGQFALVMIAGLGISWWLYRKIQLASNIDDDHNFTMLMVAVLVALFAIAWVRFDHPKG